MDYPNPRLWEIYKIIEQKIIAMFLLTYIKSKLELLNEYRSKRTFQ